MKVAVTGGAGQLGTLVVERLLRRPDVDEVLTLDLREPVTVGGKLRHRTADVRSSGFEEHLEGVDVLIHLAFLIMDKVDPEVFRAVNVEGSKNVFQAALAAGVKHIVYTSSIAAYGVVPGHPVPITEEATRKRQPEFPYSAAKFDVEEYLDELEPAHPELTVTRFRPSILIGKHMPHAMGRLMEWGYVLDIGETPAPLVWDADVADAIVLALEKGAQAHGAFNVGATDPLPARKLAEVGGLRYLRTPRWALELYGRMGGVLEALRILPATDPSWFRVTDVPMVSSSEKARRVLGWSPRYPTCTDVVEAYKAHRTGTPDRRIKRFVKLANMSRYARVSPGARREMERMSLSIHLQIEGSGGADVHLQMLAARMSARLQRPRAPDAVLTVSRETFLGLLSGDNDVMSAQMLGRLKVKGEPASIMVLSSLIGNLRRLAERGGVTGWAARRVTQPEKARA